MTGKHEYVPAPDSIDAMAERTGLDFLSGQWGRLHVADKSRSSEAMDIFASHGWSELSVKLALLGLNPPVLKQLGANARTLHAQR